MGVTLAVFHCVRKCPEAMIWLKITVKSFAMTGADILCIFDDRLSRPVAL
jgi:hypothetical protein